MGTVFFVFILVAGFGLKIFRGFGNRSCIDEMFWGVGETFFFFKRYGCEGFLCSVLVLRVISCSVLNKLFGFSWF